MNLATLLVVLGVVFLALGLFQVLPAVSVTLGGLLLIVGIVLFFVGPFARRP